MRLLVDMSLSPAWCDSLAREGHDALHWAAVGDPGAPDPIVLAWARANQRILFTHDLGFGAILAAAGADGPRVVQIRTQDPTPAAMARVVAEALRQFGEQLTVGAIVVVDPVRSRARVLPLR